MGYQVLLRSLLPRMFLIRFTVRANVLAIEVKLRVAKGMSNETQKEVKRLIDGPINHDRLVMQKKCHYSQKPRLSNILFLLDLLDSFYQVLS